MNYVTKRKSLAEISKCMPGRSENQVKQYAHNYTNKNLIKHKRHRNDDNNQIEKKNIKKIKKDQTDIIGMNDINTSLLDNDLLNNELLIDELINNYLSDKDNSILSTSDNINENKNNLTFTQQMFQDVKNDKLLCNFF